MDPETTPETPAPETADYTVVVDVFNPGGHSVITFEVAASKEQIYLPGYETPAPRNIIDLLKRSSLG